ncbi:signal peptidase I [Nocardioides humilatus]|uniref:Signal peptidase I n=1 Tax=Nocardioides humilatus TaxID=2607660 RepID=A0A5B1LAQ6_9ACTN|nr:Ig-like domain-containing protein [Nocardioides humilatus]KAA1416860.1 signal peptidase I [Nocardioides humilatus]
MPSRPLTLMAITAVVGVAGFGMPSFSSASFNATTGNASSTVSAANDWTPPTVSVNDPGTVVKDTVTITATAADTRSGINNVVIQYFAPGAAGWTTICTATTAPYSCSWNTKSGVDGSYSLRAIATDNVGYMTFSDEVSTQVANNLLVVLSDPGDIVKGSVNLTTTIYNAGLSVPIVKVEYAVTGTTTWKNLCTTLVIAPYTCVWNTAGAAFTQGESYDLRATATIGTTNTTSAVVTDVLIDNVAPTVTMTDPGTPLRGTATFAATATDADAGIAQVQLQYQRSGTSTWTTFCTPTAEPYSCRYNTTQLADGTYAFRAVATDAIGNATTSATVTNRVIDNTVASVSMEDPGAYLSGTVTLTSTASSTAGIASVRIERAVNGTSTWTTVCTDTSSPYTCSWDTTAVADGLYDLRAVMTDSRGATTTSTIVSARRVDNSPLKAYDVQATNGASAGKLAATDTLKLTYSEQINLTTVLAGWNGSSTSVVVRLRDSIAAGSSGNNDTVDILKAVNGTVIPLGTINLKGNFIKNNKTAQFNATMVATNTTVNGNTATLITLTLGTLANGSGLRAGAAANMVWTPSASVTDLTGRACSTTPVTELGALDKDF